MGKQGYLGELAYKITIKTISLSKYYYLRFEPESYIQFRPKDFVKVEPEHVKKARTTSPRDLERWERVANGIINSNLFHISP